MVGLNDLELRDLGRTYRAGVPVLRGVNLSVREGERFALLGPSGSGKTTLLRLVAGFERPDTGDVRIGGRSVSSEPAERRAVGVVFQEPLLFPHLSVFDNVAFGLRVRRQRPEVVREAVTAMLTRVGLADLASRRPQSLSGGQAQRVALARALVNRPSVLLLDEPFSALDTALRRDLRDWLVSLQQDTGTTMVLVTHDQEEAVAVGQRVGVLHGGALVQIGPPEELYARPATVTVARFLGGVNFVPGRQRGHDVVTALGTFRVPTDHDGPVTFTVRPEALVRAEDEGGANRLHGVVTEVNFAGPYQRVRVDCAEQSLTWHAPPSERVSPGERVTLTPAHGGWAVPASGDDPHERDLGER